MRYAVDQSIVLLACSVLLTTSSIGQETLNEPRDDPAARFQREASAYMFTDLTSDRSLELHRQPLMHWSNPARNGEDGVIFLWTKDDLPAVIGTFFTYVYKDELRRKQSFRVLTNNPIRATNADRVMWTPPADSVAFRHVPNAPPPAATPAQRHSQLRLLARRFSVALTLKDGRKEQCRLVPQPLFRYDDNDPEQPAGAIFSFAVGTDPEALLILQRLPDERQNAAWHYAFVRFTYNPLEGFFNQQPVWGVEKSESLTTSIFDRPDYQREPYITFRSEWLK